MKKPLMALLLLLPAASIQAQYLTPGGEPQPIAAESTATENEEDEFEYADLVRLPVETYMNLNLPPLHVLLENARERSPQVNMFATKTEYEERELKTLRRSWQKLFKFNGNFSYGLTDTNSQIYQNDVNIPPVYNVSGTAQRWWNVGASISLPLDEIFNRRNRNQQQKKRIESIKYETDSWYDEICMKIIEAYSNAAENLAVLGPAAQSMIAARAQYQTAEADFINGKTDAQTLSRQKSIESDAIRQYEQTRAMLNKSLLQLEILSKTPIISKRQQAPGANQ